MKKTLKKIISIAILIAIIFSIPVLGNDTRKEDIFDKNVFNNLEINAGLAETIKSEFNNNDKLKNISIYDIENDLYKLSTYKNHMGILLNSAFKNEFLKSNIYSENFAGSFLDKELNLNICLTNDKFKEKYLEFFNDKLIAQFSELASKAVELPRSYSNISDIIKINFVYHEKSYDELLEVCDYLKYKMVELDILQLYIDESKNKIYAHIKDDEAIKEIEEYLKNNNFDISIMEYIIDETKSTYNATYTAYGGRTIAISSEGYVPTGTIMCNAFDSNGKYGVVTSSHVAPANVIMRYENGVDIGKTSISIKDGYMDAAFVPFDNTFFTKWEKTAYVSAIGSNIYTAIARIATNAEYLQGARVVKYGTTTGYTVGIIEFVNFNTKVGSRPVYDLFKYSNNSIEGDSGGPVVLNTGLPNAGNYLAGIHTIGSSENNWGAGYRAFRVEERLGVTLLTNTTMP